MDERHKAWFFEIHHGLPRQGPGDFNSTQHAFSQLIDLPAHPHILDIGCGPGKQTLDLAKLSNGQILAIDNHQPFLDELSYQVLKQGFLYKIDVRLGDMFHLEFEKETFDVIWSEGAIYIIGFEEGLNDWKPFLKSGGYVVVSEITWLKTDPPAEVVQFWNEYYPAMQTIEGNIDIIQKAGYELINRFILPESAWWKDYYDPLEKNIKQFCQRYNDRPEAIACAELEQVEIDLFRKYAGYYGYVFYIIRNSAAKHISLQSKRTI